MWEICKKEQLLAAQPFNAAIVLPNPNPVIAQGANPNVGKEINVLTVLREHVLELVERTRNSNAIAGLRIDGEHWLALSFYNLLYKNGSRMQVKFWLTIQKFSPRVGKTRARKEGRYAPRGYAARRRCFLRALRASLALARRLAFSLALIVLILGSLL